MKIVSLALALFFLLLVVACGREYDSPLEESKDKDAVLVKLEGVVVRQYLGHDLRFELRMDSVALREKDGELDASGAVQAILLEPLWKYED